MFRVIALPADEGDCNLVSWGTSSASLKHMLIDGGTSATGERILIALQSLGIAELELLVVTHIDADHIAGIIKATKDSRFPRVVNVWFNGKDQMLDPDGPKLEGTGQSDKLSVFIDGKQTTGWRWNEPFGRGIYVPDDADSLQSLQIDGLEITIMGPIWSTLHDVLKEWPTAQRELAFAFEDETMLELMDESQGPDFERDERICLDRSVPFDLNDFADSKWDADNSKPNGGSIAFLLKYDDKEALFTADAFADSMERGLALLKRDSPLFLDLYKVPHHGSARNNSDELFALVSAKRYLFCSSGARHELPDRLTVARLLNSSVENPQLIFNYDVPCTEVWGERTYQEKYEYSAVYPATNGDLTQIMLSDKGIDSRT